jgi:putative NADPH-quinone reductase
VKKILLVYCHPNAHASRANRLIVEELRQIPHLTFHPLYDTYPEFYIDVAREKRLLLEHHVVIFQHPFYWYSMPPLMKLWLDQVLEYDFAYGPAGGSLRGKQLLLSVTAGGSFADYAPGALHGNDIGAYLAPYEQTARFCEMDWQAPEVFYEALGAGDQALLTHARKLRARVEHLARVPHGKEEA